MAQRPQVFIRETIFEGKRELRFGARFPFDSFLYRCSTKSNVLSSLLFLNIFFIFQTGIIESGKSLEIKHFTIQGIARNNNIYNPAETTCRSLDSTGTCFDGIFEKFDGGSVRLICVVRNRFAGQILHHLKIEALGTKDGQFHCAHLKACGCIGHPT